MSKDDYSSVAIILVLLVVLTIVRGYFVEARDRHIKETLYEQTVVRPV